MFARGRLEGGGTARARVRRNALFIKFVVEKGAPAAPLICGDESRRTPSPYNISLCTRRTTRVLTSDMHTVLPEEHNCLPMAL